MEKLKIDIIGGKMARKKRKTSTRRRRTTKPKAKRRTRRLGGKMKPMDLVQTGAMIGAGAVGEKMLADQLQKSLNVDPKLIHAGLAGAAVLVGSKRFKNNKTMRRARYLAGGAIGNALVSLVSGPNGLVKLGGNFSANALTRPSYSYLPPSNLVELPARAGVV